MNPSREWGPFDVIEGAPYSLVGYVVGGDGRTLLTNAGTGQPGVTTVDWRVYRTGGPSPNTLLYSASLAATRCFASAAQIGDGFTTYAKGWNFRLAVPGGANALFTALAPWQLKHEFEIHATGVTADPGAATNPVSWDPIVLTALVNVCARRSA